jgi:hypothetical protein
MNKFGSRDFFFHYLKNQIEKEGKTHEAIYRVHFAMSNLILETNKGKDALSMLNNLNLACEEISKSHVRIGWN